MELKKNKTNKNILFKKVFLKNFFKKGNKNISEKLYNKIKIDIKKKDHNFNSIINNIIKFRTTQLFLKKKNLKKKNKIVILNLEKQIQFLIKNIYNENKNKSYNIISNYLIENYLNNKNIKKDKINYYLECYQNRF